MSAREIGILAAGFITGIGTAVGVAILLAVAAWRDIRG